MIGNPQKYLECPNCNKCCVDDTTDFPLVCGNCGELFNEEDMCGECEKLVKGCYYCKMD